MAQTWIMGNAVIVKPCRMRKAVRNMKASLQQQAERYLGTEIKPSEWVRAKAGAEHKLASIIEREGDLNGARREPWYLAQLIAETVQINTLSIKLKHLADLQRAKKDSPRKSVRPLTTKAYCSTAGTEMQ